MSPAPATIDISNKPELLRLAEEVRTANTPRLLRNKQETVTVLMPAETAKENDKRLSSSPSNNWKLERYAIVRLTDSWFCAGEPDSHPPLTLKASIRYTTCIKEIMLLLKNQSEEEKRSSVENNEQEEDEYSREPEPDEHSKNTPNHRSRYVFATMSFLMALLFLSGYLNNDFELASGWLLLLGLFAFGAVGVLFLWPKSIFNRLGSGSIHEQDDAAPNDVKTEDDSLEGDVAGGEETEQGELSSFELLVEEALATIPEEFHERMENVLVRVQDEPGKEVLERVGIKKGYTLLGLYEGVPLIASGHDRTPHPEIITIYQHTIES